MIDLTDPRHGAEVRVTAFEPDPTAPGDATVVDLLVRSPDPLGRKITHQFHLRMSQAQARDLAVQLLAFVVG